MVTITINGVKKDREFQNMAQALAFVYQNGECHNAERLEIAYAAGTRNAAHGGPGGRPAGKTAEETGQKSETAQGQAVTPAGGAESGGGSAEQAGKPLEQMTRQELEAIAKKLGVTVKKGIAGFFEMKIPDLIAAIRAAEVPTPQAEGAESTTEGGSEQAGKPLEEMSRKELEDYAYTLGFSTEVIMSFVNEAHLIAAIKIKQKEAANGGGGDNPDQAA